MGSGFLIDGYGHILTARHVALSMENEPGARWVTVALRHRHATAVPAQVISCDGFSIDLCLIKISQASVTAADIKQFFVPACRHVNTDENVRAYGYSAGSNNPIFRVQRRIIGELSTDLKYPSNVTIYPGMSGGPVIDGSNRAVAVNTAGADGLPSLTFLQPLLYGSELIRRTGSTCDQAALALPPAVTMHASAIRCPDKLKQLARVSRESGRADYIETITADKGCRIIGAEPSIKSRENASSFQINVDQTRQNASVAYSLRKDSPLSPSWLSGEIVVRQATIQ